MTQMTFLVLTFGFLVACWLALDDNLRRLSGLFSSIEDRTLAWLRWVMILIVVAWGWAALQGILDQLTPAGGWLGAVDAAITLSWVGLLAYFGIRQRPAMLEADARDAPLPETAEKYARSALDTDRMQKLGERMVQLMQAKTLYRDPGLSLRGLADKVGASPNYISQTLNDHLGVSFFDFVNGFRVDEAEALLRETDRSVTDIALEVGFNSRSTFNAAVRKHRGLSPTEMRRG
jgi:AraC-like DNA-binding protein